MSLAGLFSSGATRGLSLALPLAAASLLAQAARAQDNALKTLPKSSTSAPLVIEKKESSESSAPTILPEGKTLPEGVVRARLPFKSIQGEHGYDADGNKVDMGLALHATAGAFVLEYGVTDRISVQMVAPVIYRNELALSADRFRDSDAYATNHDKFIGTMASLLVGARPQICPSFDACLELIDEGYALPVDRVVTLPSGETLTLRRGVPLKLYADSAVVRAATPTDGRTGLGDLETGVLFAVLPTGPLTYSVGLGLRYPTGSFADVPASQRGTGRGTLDAGLRQNLDYAVGRSVMLSWQNQSEVMLVKGEKKKTSLIDSSELNLADPTTSEAVSAGSDGEDNTQEFTREGVRNVGFLKAGLNLSAFSDDLRALGTYAQWNYNVDSQERLDGRALSDRKQTQSALAGIGVSGLSYQIPASLDVDYEVPTGGKNVALATSVVTMTFKAYYKF
jgi:hypothetical protein